MKTNDVAFLKNHNETLCKEENCNNDNSLMSILKPFCSVHRLSQ